MMNKIKNFCEKFCDKIGSMVNKLIDHMTPKKDYSEFDPEDAEALRKLDRTETKERIENFCFWFVYIIAYIAIIIGAVKKSKEFYEDICE